METRQHQHHEQHHEWSFIETLTCAALTLIVGLLGNFLL